MFKIRILILTILLSYLFAFSPLYAQFIDLGVGARGTGMNNAFTGLADDVYTIYYNPAGLGSIKWKEIGLDYEKLYWGLNDNSSLGNNFVAYVQSLEHWGTLGMGWSNFALTRYYSENVFMVAYGRQMWESPLDIGIKVKFLSKKYETTLYTENAINLETGQLKGSKDPTFADDYSKTGISLDLGLLYKINVNNSIGIVLNNVNHPDMGLADNDEIVLNEKIGYAYKGNIFSVAIDLVFQQEDITTCIGFERWFQNREFAIRGGLGVGNHEYANLSLGASWRFTGFFQFDYSFRYPLRGISNFYGSHQVSLTLKFGAPSEGVETDDTFNLRRELEKNKIEKDKAFEKLRKIREEVENLKE